LRYFSKKKRREKSYRESWSQLRDSSTERLYPNLDLLLTDIRWVLRLWTNCMRNILTGYFIKF